MSSYYETGHAKNVANLLKLNQLIATFGSSYNPSNTLIKSTALATLYTNANAKLTTVNANFTTWKNATNSREIAFDPLGKQATQILASLESLGIAEQTINDFVFQVKKYRNNGSKLTKADSAKVVNTETNTTPSDPNAPVNTVEIKTHSTAQLSFDNKLQHFEKMILILQSVSNYNPNETAYKVVTLQTQLTNLIALNNTANTSYAVLKSARIDRNTFFYAKNTGLLGVVKQAKAYIKSIYGSDSAQYHAITEIKFVRVIKK